MQIRDRVKELRRVPASELKKNPKNWRRHSNRQRAALSALLEEVGFVGATLGRELDDGTLEMIDGHLRADIADDEIIPVLVVDLTEPEADVVLATLDPIAGLADTDEKKFADLAGILTTDNAAITDLIDSVSRGASAILNNVNPELEISPELHERQDYIVVVVDNEMDWAVLCHKLGIGTVIIPMPDGCGLAKRGIGRVVPAARLLALLDGEKPGTVDPAAHGIKETEQIKVGVSLFD